MKKNMLRKNALVISPHQDDWVIGCGGIISKLNKFNWGVLYFYSADKKAEAIDSEKLFEIERHWFIDCLPRSIKYNFDINKIVQIIRSFKPSLLIIVNNDGDRDHDFCCEIIKEAIFLTENNEEEKLGKKWEIDSIIGYSVWSEIKKPQFSVDITDEMNNKVSAINLHKSQIKTFDYESLIKNRAKIYGLLSGYEFAEAFEVIKIKEII